MVMGGEWAQKDAQHANAPPTASFQEGTWSSMLSPVPSQVGKCSVQCITLEDCSPPDQV
jgi:hypothetical protein